MIVGYVKDPFKGHPRQRFEQYFTFAQSLAHFLRHSNFSPHLSQVRGSKPFLVFAFTSQLNLVSDRADHKSDNAKRQEPNKAQDVLVGVIRASF